MMYINYSLEASSEHLRVLAGSALRMTGSDARSQLGHARTKKKTCFHNRLCCPDCSQSASHRRIPACVRWLESTAPALAVLLWSRSCNDTRPVKTARETETCQELCACAQRPMFLRISGTDTCRWTDVCLLRNCHCRIIITRGAKNQKGNLSWTVQWLQ